MINIGGFQKLTLLDYPNKIGCLIFLQGCNFNCKFCHNQDLINNRCSKIQENEVLDFLNKRKNVLEGVCISGGEPTLYNDLPDFIRKIKKFGYLVKLDTNGTNPEMIKYLIDNNLIDYIAMDIKNSIEKYSITSNKEVELDKIKESISIILENKIDYEFRTTIIMEEHDLYDFHKIGKLIYGAKKYFLQPYRETEELISLNYTTPNENYLEEIKNIIKKYVNSVQIR